MKKKTTCRNQIIQGGGDNKWNDPMSNYTDILKQTTTYLSTVKSSIYKNAMIETFLCKIQFIPYLLLAQASSVELKM